MFSFYHYIDQLASTDITDHSVRCKHCEHCEHCEPAFEESLPLSISFWSDSPGAQTFTGSSSLQPAEWQCGQCGQFASFKPGEIGKLATLRQPASVWQPAPVWQLAPVRQLEAVGGGELETETWQLHSLAALRVYFTFDIIDHWPTPWILPWLPDIAMRRSFQITVVTVHANWRYTIFLSYFLDLSCFLRWYCTWG